MIALLREWLSGTVDDGIDGDLPVLESSFAVIDTELTGLNARRDSILSIGGIRMDGGRIDLGETCHWIVAPGTEISAESIMVHGITPSDVASKPSIGSVLSGFLTFVRGRIIVGHFISIDLAFLNRELKRAGLDPLANPVVDTCSLDEWVRRQRNGFAAPVQDDLKYKDLFTLAKRYGVEVSSAHNALMDAYVTAQVFQKLLSELPDHGVATVRHLLRAGRP